MIPLCTICQILYSNAVGHAKLARRLREWLEAKGLTRMMFVNAFPRC
jgi:hypothetical protein